MFSEHQEEFLRWTALDTSFWKGARLLAKVRH
jgi:hypothetical protein